METDKGTRSRKKKKAERTWPFQLARGACVYLPRSRERYVEFLSCEIVHGRSLLEPPATTSLTPTVSKATEEKFIRLRDQWKAETAHVSSTTRLVLHPAYQAIIGMGPDVVPLLLRELERRVDNWFWALHAVTQADPAPTDSQGDGQKMAKAWLVWGKEQGYEW